MIFAALVAVIVILHFHAWNRPYDHRIYGPSGPYWTF
jgi:hypothetical protein